MKYSDNESISYSATNPKPKRGILFFGVFLIAVSGLLVTAESFATNRGAPTHSSRSSFQAVMPQTDLEPIRSQIVYKGEDFREIWRTVELDNVEPRDTDYAILGDEAADTYIRSIGEERGYERQYVARGNLVSSSGYTMQAKARDNWQAMQTTARSEGVYLSLSSGHRDAKEQATIFQQFLRTNVGFIPSAKQIKSDKYKTGLQRTLDRVAPPGYSKHQTGYTIDICDAVRSACATRFADTPGERWLRDNNYANARKFGFIPSYPPDVENQGPNPEPWEYVWVGTENLNFRSYLRIYNES